MPYYASNRDHALERKYGARILGDHAETAPPGEKKPGAMPGPVKQHIAN